ncbi:mitochondrial resolvase Ydc2 [Aspergillus welwitschiae]|uniref:Mitochondrial resolvase Ydc2 n=1 Tax=Aspergillus welwitschiae TaxID=1341132 RepID=A0A3F3Q4L7_9EURO|nr:mitochondrial resolvase Ydc2 [Aspergillus welwitschiae]RDH34143.1 mitochondrial resolvase Ydc2 [Aspergillus welwitschiae]
MKYPWLRPLKAKALQQIAQKTGIQSSGTKAVLVERLGGELTPLFPHIQNDRGKLNEYKNEKRRNNDDNDGIRVLSIDMGIRNLAFAVLHSPYPSSSSSSTSSSSSVSLSSTGSSEAYTPRDKAKEGNSITLTAWKRLSIPDLCYAQHEGTPSLITATTKPKSQVTEEAKEDFSPSLYARHAYTLITTLLSTYNPTHILIERQRFRTGGGSAVQEWTIRVGVLEGMLYAVLETINSSLLSSSSSSSSSSPSSGGKVQVYPVEPGRVSRFWGEEFGDIGDGGGDMVVKKQKKRKNVRDVKKMKIALVREWLVSAANDDGDGRVVLGGSVGEGNEVRELASAFLEKCEGKRRTKKGGDGVDIGKLDDLADCLVQGVTWLEWQMMREKIVTEGGINL